MSRWLQVLARYDVEAYDRDECGRLWWFMFDGPNPAAVDQGRARWRWTRAVAIWAAYVRRWWRDR